MAPYPPYLIDSNAFIESKNRYYAFDICPGFWLLLFDGCNYRPLLFSNPLF